MPPDLSSTAFVFPGQGSQKVGMGRALAQAEPAAAAVFAEADEVLGVSLSKLCWDGPEAELNDTVNTQPALLVHSVAVLRALEGRGLHTSPAFAAGHSLGEFSALVASGALTFREALRLVRARGLAMKAAGESNPGGMAAVLGLDVEVVDAACRQAREATRQAVEVANDNCPGQVVISGAEPALAAAGEILKGLGARRVVRLAVSIAAHSSLMASAQQTFGAVLEKAQVAEPRLTVIGNVQASPLRSAQEIRVDLEAQLTSRVRWTESIRTMVTSGVTRFFEIGTGEVLSGLIRRTDPSVQAAAVDLPESFAPLLG
ncbi:MAG TPA: ACP S-malonyltransferase [Anaerolineales bacterium]|nr:ACP S-malonyltransferase [Anaerolineales bacterium]